MGRKPEIIHMLISLLLILGVGLYIIANNVI